MTASRAEIVVCGAGIAGIAAAYHLAVRHGVRDVVLVDERPPMSLTSDKSTECYRNWWPGPDDAMVAFTNRSIDLLEEHARASGNRFALNRRGYLWATARESGVEALRAAARESCGLGAGELREHAAGDSEYLPAPASGFEDLPEGADLILDPGLIRRHFPYLNPETLGILHARRCGWMSAQQLGAYLLEEARAHGARFLPGRLLSVDAGGGRVRGVRVAGKDGIHDVATPVLVNAAGPYVRHVAEMIGVALPVVCEGHVKASIHDARGAVSQDAPMIIWADPVRLPWSEEERAALADAPEGRALLEEFPAGVHGRPAGGDSVLLYWTYHYVARDDPVFPIPWDPDYPEILLRGMSAMVPALADYFGHLPRPFVDGGYYTKTPENRPLVGPLPVEGAHVTGAYSGFGIMAACAGGELLAAHVTGADLPPYARAFLPARYDDPAYRKQLESWPSGQL